MIQLSILGCISFLHLRQPKTKGGGCSGNHEMLRVDSDKFGGIGVRMEVDNGLARVGAPHVNGPRIGTTQHMPSVGGEARVQ